MPAEATREDLLLLLKRLPEVRRRLLEALTPDSCIETSRVVCDLLRERGFAARVAPVEARILNAKAAAALARGESDRLLDSASGSYVLVVGDPHYPARGRWAGHLVVLCEGFLIDASIDQASRPQRGIILDAPLVARVPADFSRDGARVRFHRGDGVVVEYVHRRRNLSYHRTLAWQQAPLLMALARSALHAPDA